MVRIFFVNHRKQLLLSNMNLRKILHLNMPFMIHYFLIQ